MKLTSGDFERQVRASARNAMRHDPTVWKEYRTRRTYWVRRQLEQNAWHVLPFFYLILVMIMVMDKIGAAHLLVLCGAIYASSTTIFRGMSLRFGALQGHYRAVLMYLPISDEKFLRYVMRQSVWSWSGAAAGFLLIYGDALYMAGRFANWAALAVIAALLQSACGLCLAMLLIAFAPRVLTATVATPLFLLVFACIWSPPVAELSWPAVLVVPGGWVSCGFGGAAGIGNGNPFWFVPAFLLVACLPLAYSACRKALLSELSAQNLDAAATSSAVLGREDEDWGPEDDGSAEPQDVTAQPANLEAWKGRLLEPADWAHAGWMERLADRTFDRRERIVAEFMLGGRLGAWSKQWRISVLVTLAGVALLVVLHAAPAWVYILPAVAGAFLGAPLFGGFWRGFARARTSGYLVPIYAGYPASYAEISKVIWKSNAVRLLAWMLLGYLHIIALAMKFGKSLDFGIVVSTEIIMLLLALQPAMIAGRFSAGTNDTNSLSWRVAALITMSITLLAAFGVSVVFLFATESSLGKCLGTLGMFASSAGAWWRYRLLFDRGRIDVLSKPQ